MMRIKKYFFRTFAFLVIGASVVACDNEPVDPMIDTGGLVGKPVIEVSKDGEAKLIRSGFTATLNKRSEFTLHMPNLFEDKDQLNIFTLLFVEGSFPGNANASSYYSSEQVQWYSSVNPLRPEFVTGIVDILSINKIARAVKGKFDLRMTPVTTEGESSPSVATALRFIGDFTDVPYTREEPFYLEAEVASQVFRNTNTIAKLQAGNLQISSVSIDAPEQKLELSVPVDFLETGESITLSDDQFQMIYFSEFGVEYKYLGTAQNSDTTSKITVVCQDKEKGIYSGKFNVSLDSVLEQIENKLSISYGDFRVEIQ